MDFKKLTPDENININTYKEALDYALSDKDINNIALSGNYGAGKSSIIESYKGNVGKNKNFLHISLAYFTPQEKEKYITDNEQKDLYLKILEGKILNQLIHKIDSNIVSKTNFKIRENCDENSVAEKSFTIILFVICVLYFIFYRELTDFVANEGPGCIKNILVWLMSTKCTIGVFVLSICLAFYFLYTLIRLQLNKNWLRKIKIQSSEIELFDENESSYFDKYLNEIVYLFNESQIDVVVFEDIDRHNVIKIFERLREINTIINTKRNSNNKIKFLYLLRDEIFETKERTKFFDFIIPVLPVMNSSNSFNIILDFFKGEAIFEGVTEKFLNDISLYIDDMRLLKNVCNEFMIYYERIQQGRNIDIDKEKLLSLIIYKNMFPKDFSDLQLANGYVYNLFDKKTAFVENSVKENERKIVNLQAEKSCFNDEILKSEEEFNDLINYYSRYAGKLSKVGDVQKRKEKFNERKEKQLYLVDSKIKALQNEIKELTTKRLKDVINKDNAESIFDGTYGFKAEYDTVAENPYFDLIKYLVRNGYIDETYNDYLTYFYDNFVSVNDRNFMRHVIAEKGHNYSYMVDEPSKVIMYLDDYYFSKEETLNFRLFGYLLENDNSKYKHLKIRLLDQLKENNNINFIIEFCDSKPDVKYDVLFKYLIDEWHDFYRLLFADENLNVLMKNQLLCKMINVLNIEEINLIDDDSTISDYLVYSKEFYSNKEVDVNKLVQFMKIKSVKVDGFDYETVNEDLLNNIFKENLYRLSFENIMLMMHKFNAENFIGNEKSIYTFAFENEDENQYNYFKNNINQFVDVVINNNDEICDSEEAVIDIVNNVELNQELKEKYIDKLSLLKFSIKDISTITDKKLWSNLIKNNFVQNNSENLLACFERNNEIGDDELTLINNKGNEEYDFKSLKPKECEESLEKFFVAIVNCSDICNVQYRNILKNLNRYYDTFNIEGMPYEKISILIDINVIRMNLNNFEFIKSNYENNVEEFIMKNQTAFAELCVEQGGLLDEEASLYLLCEDISDELKIGLLKLNDDSVSIKDKVYSDEVFNYILMNNFENEDLEYLIQHYFEYSVKQKNAVMNKIKVNIVDVVNLVATNETLVDEILKSTMFDENDKLLVILEVLEHQDTKDLEMYFRLAGLKEWISIFDNKNPKIKVSEQSTHMLKKLSERKIVSSYPEKNGYYQVHPKRR